jgi:putative toxin-antitoxin system antitoxin component (TIGR02293 family)
MNPATVSDVLGLHIPESAWPTSLMDEVEKGLPLTALERVAKAVAPDDAAFAYRMVARATLGRRRRARRHAGSAAASRLSSEEGARVARLAGVWTIAREVWGSDEAARRFLFEPHPLLENRRPVDVVLANELGRPLVEGILERRQYGSPV